MAGVADGDTFRLRLTFDTAGAVRRFVGGNEYFELNSPVASMISVRGYTFATDGSASSMGQAIQYAAGDQAAAVGSQQSNTLIVRDPSNSYYDLQEIYTTRLDLSFVDAFFVSPLDLGRSFVWTGGEYAGDFSYLLTDYWNEYQTSGRFQFFATAVTATVLDPGPAPVPLPAGLPLLAAGLGGLALWRRRLMRVPACPGKDAPVSGRLASDGAQEAAPSPARGVSR